MTEREKRIKRFEEYMQDSVVNAEFLAKELDYMGFFTAPASTRFHGAYEGGLFDHSLTVAKKLVEMTEKMGLPWEHPRSPKLVGMLHDICKCDSYVPTPDGGWVYKKDQILTGHGDKSVILCQLMEHTPFLTEEEVLCIRYHMGAYESESMWQNYGAAIGKYENVLWTHAADMWASKVMRT